MPRNIITQKRLKKLLRYNKKTGLFHWLKSGKGRNPDLSAGSMSYGYIQIVIEGRAYKTHRLAIFYVTGKWPIEVDHDDHDRSNNKWKNIKEVTSSMNSRNRSLSRRNTSKVMGVFWSKKSNKWQAQITINRKHIHLGLHTLKSDATAARKAADIKYGFHKNHGK